MKVYDYMCNESIEELMVSKLTSEELQYAKQEIKRLSSLTKEQLSAKIRKEQRPEEYEQLSMVDSYIFHLLANLNYSRNMLDSNREISAQLEQNAWIKQKSFYCASNPYLKK